jgi:flagellar hook-length control protein FliK
MNAAAPAAEIPVARAAAEPLALTPEPSDAAALDFALLLDLALEPAPGAVQGAPQEPAQEPIAGDAAVEEDVAVLAAAALPGAAPVLQPPEIAPMRGLAAETVTQRTPESTAPRVATTPAAEPGPRTPSPQAEAPLAAPRQAASPSPAPAFVAQPAAQSDEIEAAAPPGGSPGAGHGAGTAAEAPQATPPHAAPPPAIPQARHSVQMQVAVPVTSPEFDAVFAARISVAARAGVESASIALNPPELGPVELRVNVIESQAHVHFAAESRLAREAIAEALPRLLEMLAAQGLELAGGSVSAELPRREPQPAPPPGAPRAEPPADEERDGAAASRWIARQSGTRLVDEFA